MKASPGSHHRVEGGWGSPVEEGRTDVDKSLEKDFAICSLDVVRLSSPSRIDRYHHRDSPSQVSSLCEGLKGMFVSLVVESNTKHILFELMFTAMIGTLLVLPSLPHSSLPALPLSLPCFYSFILSYQSFLLFFFPFFFPSFLHSFLPFFVPVSLPLS